VPVAVTPPATIPKRFIAYLRNEKGISFVSKKTKLFFIVSTNVEQPYICIKIICFSNKKAKHLYKTSKS
jgi:hypothetical protein